MYRDHMRDSFQWRDRTEHSQWMNGGLRGLALPPVVKVLACLLVCLMFGLAAWL